MADRVGQHLGNYHLLRLLGQGSFAEVYLGEHAHLGTSAAIKVLHSQLSKQDLDQLRTEARIIANLEHPHIVRVLEFGVEEHIAFLVMSYAPGGSLRERHPKGTQLPLDTITSYITQIAQALQYAHQQKLIHRDIKPENMLLGRHDEVLLCDFGLATLSQSSRSQHLLPPAGSIAYMAPEQIRAHPVPASDQYALGVVVYEWLCGARPFSGTVTEVAVKHTLAPPPPLREHVPSLPAAVEQVVLKALAKEPQQRYGQVLDFAQALEEACKAESSARTLPMPASALPVEAEFGKHARAPGVLQPVFEAPGGSDRPWNVPFGRNPFFTGRGQLLERLHAQLSRSHSAALNQSYALSGLGGIGKTQTAIEYAYRYREQYSAVFWVRADSRETLVADYVAIARLLGLPGQDAQDQMVIVAATKRWLEEHQGWLLILDNADELQLVTDFLPAGGQGHLLLTTRAQATGKIAQSLPVEKMEQSEGMQLLLRRAKLLDPEESLDNVSAAVCTAAQKLVSELDGLPLALDQAGAYIEDTGCNLSEYLELYGQHRLVLLQQQSSISTDYPHTVASTWVLSFAQVEQQGRAAADLLRLCAFLQPDAIPEVIFMEGAAELGPVLSHVAADPLQFNAAIQLLRRYSLVKRDPEAKLLNMHRLVQVVLKESLDEAAQRQWAERSIRAVNQAFPPLEFASWERCELFVPQALVCAQLIEQYGFTFSEAARLLHAVGHYLRDRGQYARAEPLIKQALSMREQVLGLEHPDTASTLNVLAYLYILQGKFQQAEGLLQPALANFERVLGSAHPEVATALNTLAAVYLHEGKYVQAEPLYQRALAMREQALGESHPDVVESFNDLAVLYNLQGQFAQAESLYQRALTLYENTKEPENPETLVALSNLGYLYTSQGKYAQAERLLQRVLATQESVLGREQLDTGMSLSKLGRLYTLQGKYVQAESLLQRALALHERLLGAEHHYTIRDLLFLAQLLQSTGQEAHAESLYQQALARFERVLGSEHPRVAETLTGLAQLYTRQGHYEKAEPLLERALTIDEHALGPEHPQMATVLDAQGHLALLQGQDEQAERLLQKAIAIREKVLGNTHPDVAHTLCHLAELYEKQGKHEQARSLYQQALTIREQALGPDHPDTVATQETLTSLLQVLQAQAQQSLTSQPRSVPPV